MQLHTLADILNLALTGALDMKKALYTVDPVQWKLETPAILLDPEALTIEEIGMLETKNLQRRLNADQLLEIIANAKLQRENVTMAQLIEAVSHYYEHDAFLRLT